MAGQQQRKNISRTFVLVETAAPETVLGFYTLSVSEVSRGSLPNPHRLPERVPVVRLGRFAVQAALQGKGLGERLLLNALERIVEISQNAGIAAVVVDAKDARAADYYRRFDFVAAPDTPLQLFIATQTLQQAFRRVAGSASG
ncbi:MAG: hypothetical protein RIR00_965 [Pseudomonadota bacterium]